MAQNGPDPADALRCQSAIAERERALGIPEGLLHAIAVAESGRTLPGVAGVLPWPWTINVDGRGLYFDTKQEAVNEVRRLMEAGANNIDIGCMQVSQRFHPDAFRSLEDAFDPQTNVRYAADFLIDLAQRHGSWSAAVGRYHTADPVRGGDYRRRVMALWQGGDTTRVAAAAVRREDEETPFHMASVSFREGRFDRSYEIYADLVARNPDDRLARLGVAVSLARMNRTMEAERAFIELLRLAPDHAMALAWLTDHLSSLPPSESASTLRRLLDIAPGHAEFPALLAQGAVMEEDLEQALAYQRRAVAAAPDNARHLLNLAVLLDRMGSRNEALVHYQRFLDVYRSHPTLLTTSLDGVRQRVRYLRAAARQG